MAGMEITWPVAEPEKVAFAGDWHGNADVAWRGLHTAAEAGCSVLIQLGDFGIWPGGGGEWYLAEVSRAAKETGVLCAFIDGNHEDFDQLLAMPVDACGLRPVSEQVWHIPRASRWTWHGAQIVALGGATSLDRHMRRAGRSWWAQEEILDTELADAAAGGPCDVLLTHDCPTGTAIPGIRHREPSPYWPIDELERAWNHRDRLASILPQLQPSRIIHGHFHTRYCDIAHFSGNKATMVDGLADDSAGTRGNLLVMSARQLAWDAPEGV